MIFNVDASGELIIALAQASNLHVAPTDYMQWNAYQTREALDYLLAAYLDAKGLPCITVPDLPHALRACPKLTAPAVPPEDRDTGCPFLPDPPLTEDSE